MPRVLIAGCGYLGKALAQFLVERCWEVEGWARTATSTAPAGYEVHNVDITDRAPIAARGGNFDAVVHCASTRGGGAADYRRVYVDGVRNLLEQFSSASLLFTSSTSVYAQDDGSWVTEQSPAEPRRDTGRLLLEAENLVLARGGTVARVAGIYGPGRSALLQKFLDGKAAVDMHNDRFINQVHRDDVVSAFALLLDRQPSTAEIYNVVDDEPVLRSACFRWLAARLHRPLSSSGASEPPRKRGDSNKRVSNAKLRAINWAPRYRTFAAGMEQSVLPSFGL